jgi:hypothetical protein
MKLNNYRAALVRGEKSMKLNNYDDDERMLRSHLSLIHGMYVTDVKTLAGLRDAHTVSHDDPDGLFCINHGHTEPPTDSLDSEVEIADDWFT